MKLRLVVRVKRPRTPRMLSGLKAARSARSWETDKNRMYGGWQEQDAGERRSVIQHVPELLGIPGHVCHAVNDKGTCQTYTDNPACTLVCHQ